MGIGKVTKIAEIVQETTKIRWIETAAIDAETLGAKVLLPQPGNSLQRFAVFGLTQVLQIRLPSLPETKMRPSSQNGTQLLSELHFWSTAHCCAPLHSTQTQLLLRHTPVDPHWASVTQSRQWWSTHE